MRFLTILATFAFMSCAHAQEKLNPVSYWEHNGSIVGMHRDGNFFVIWYENPSETMRAIGVAVHTNLFEGFFSKPSKDRIELIGKAHVFSSLCGAIPYEVNGWGADENGRATITLEGPAPILLDEECNFTLSPESPNARLRFYFIRFQE